MSMAEGEVCRRHHSFDRPSHRLWVLFQCSGVPVWESIDAPLLLCDKLNWSINEVGHGVGITWVIGHVRSGSTSEHRFFTCVAAVELIDQRNIPLSIEAMMAVEL